MNHPETIYINGECVQRIGKEIRGPLMIIAPLDKNDATTHESLDGEIWYSRKFSAVHFAKKYMNDLKFAYPHFKSTAEQMASETGGRGLKNGLGRK